VRHHFGDAVAVVDLAAEFEILVDRRAAAIEIGADFLPKN
jgi:hypothetical protein